MWYLSHVWGQLRTNEADVVVVDSGVYAWYHHRPRRRLTRDPWVMAHVAVVPCFFHISGSVEAIGDIRNQDFLSR